MILFTMNGYALLACMLFSLVSGAIWFGPKTFFPIWWRALGKPATAQPDGSPRTWVLLIASGLPQAVFMALVVNAMEMVNGNMSLGYGALLGLVVWLGVVAPSGLVNKLFPGHLQAWSIETGHHLINYLAFGAILAAWR